MPFIIGDHLFIFKCVATLSRSHSPGIPAKLPTDYTLKTPQHPHNALERQQKNNNHTFTHSKISKKCLTIFNKINQRHHHHMQMCNWLVAALPSPVAKGL